MACGGKALTVKNERSLNFIDKSILSKFLRWYLHLNPLTHYLVLSNDLDSFLSCVYLKNKFNLEIGGYYNFEKGLYLNRSRVKNKSPVFVDLSVTYGMCFDNHVSFIQNPLVINPNQGLDSYYKKYNGSTLALLLSLYDEDISCYTDEQLKTLLCIDSWYAGYYNKGGAFKDINLYWYKALGFKDYLLPILKHNNTKFFIDFAEKHYLFEEILINEHGYLFTAAKSIELPTYKFELVQPIRMIKASKKEAIEQYERNPDSIFVSAETFRDRYLLNLKSNLLN